MAFISACKSWMFKEGKVLFFLSCCQGILVAFVFAMDFKVDTEGTTIGIIAKVTGLSEADINQILQKASEQSFFKMVFTQLFTALKYAHHYAFK